MKFKFHDIDSAAESVRPELAAAQKAYGSIPNLYRGLATSPAALKVYLNMNESLAEFGQLTAVEQQVVYLTVSAENGCIYCMGAHSTLAGMARMPANILAELRQQAPLSDPGLNSLRNFTLSLMQHKGRVPEADLQAFTEAGFHQAHVLDVLTIVAQKTMSNFFNHMAQTPLDDMFQPTVWEQGKTVT